ncbi:MAG: RNA polymerase sigma-54 factor, partial [Alphaproteobacteria bacterium]
MNKPTQSLDLRQSQNLVMTPQLQQAIKLLQLNNMELNEFIEEELERNPLLEKDTGSEGDDSSPDNADAQENASASHETDSMDETFASTYESSSSASDFDAGTSAIGSGGSSKFEDPDYSFENRLESEKTLREHLQEQLFLAFDDGRDRMIGSMLIDQLDENGWLRHNRE